MTQFSLQRPTVLAVALVAALVACQQHDPATTARAYIAKGDYDSATVQLRAAVQSQPEAADLRVLLADALERKHDLPSMQENLVKALESGGDADTLIPRIAQVMLDRNELDVLIRSYRETQLTDPAADSSLRGTVALALLGQQREQLARNQIALAKAPAESVRLAQAQLLVAEGKPREALEVLDLDGAGKTAPWWTLRAAKRIAVSINDLAKAQDYMKRAVDLAPWHGGVLGEYGETLMMVNKADDAVGVRDRLRKSYPGLFWTHYLDALLLHRASRFEEGHAAALRALRAAPDHVPAQLMAASTEVQKGDLLVAERRLQALLRKSPTLLPALQLQAQVQSRLGRKAELRDALQRGLQLVPGDALLLGLQADMQLAAGQFKPALATLSALLAARPNDPDAMLRLAQAHFNSGDKVAAVVLVNQAGASATADPQVAARVVAMALRLNNPALARKLAEQNVARHPSDAVARLSLAAVQSAQNDRAAAWSTTLSVLDKQAAHAGALQALIAMARSPEQLQQVFVRHQAALDEGSKVPQTYLDFASLLRAAPTQKISTPLAVLENAVQAVPTSVPLREALVEQLLRMGDTEKALSTAQTGATMANASPAAAALLASSYERLGKLQPAAAAWRKLVADNPQRADWRLRLAQQDAAAGRDVDALNQLRSLVSERPFDIQPYLQLAQIQARTDLNAALDVARQLGEQPGFKSAGLMLAGDVLAAAQRNDEALVQYDLSSKAGGGANATLRAVQLLDRTGRAEAADRELDTAMRKQPEEGALLVEAAKRAQARGDNARAVEVWQRLAAKAPGDPYVLNDLAWAQLAAGRADAIGPARRAAAMLPNNPTVLHTLGMALSKAGKTDEAIDALRAAANLAPLAAMPRLHLAQHLAASGDKVGAANALRTLDGAGLSAPDKGSLSKLKAELGIS